MFYNIIKLQNCIDIDILVDDFLLFNHNVRQSTETVTTRILIIIDIFIDILL